MRVSRREFLRGGLAIAALGATMPSVLVRTLYAEEASGAPATARAGGAPRTLVVVQLGGGNDGLSTVVPYQDGRYYDLRPPWRSKSSATGCSPWGTGRPCMRRSRRCCRSGDRGDLAIVQGVGYPAPNRSHFRSMDIWHTAAPATIIADGWLGRYLDFTPRRPGTAGSGQGRRGRSAPRAGGPPLRPAMRNAQSYHLLPTRRRPSQPDARLIAWHALHEAAGARAGSQPLLSRTGWTPSRASRRYRERPPTTPRAPTTPPATRLPRRSRRWRR